MNPTISSRPVVVGVEVVCEGFVICPRCKVGLTDAPGQVRIDMNHCAAPSGVEGIPFPAR